MFQRIVLPEQCNKEKIQALWNKDELTVEETKELLMEMCDPDSYTLLFDVDDQSIRLYDLKEDRDLSVSDFINTHIDTFLE